jgi:Na+-transporting methylmalonyl-CoA/oxaloacetate decarboxylase beta subunit
MSVKREDLLAAAALGVVQYKQVDPLLIFLLQRDVNQQREAMLKQRQASRVSILQALFYPLVLLIIGATVALVALYAKLTVEAVGIGGLLWFIGLYALFTLMMVAWFERRKIATSVRVFCTSLIALLPLAVFASQRLGL